MEEPNEEQLKTLEHIQNLQDFLKTEMSIEEPIDGTVKADV